MTEDVEKLRKRLEELKKKKEKLELLKNIRDGQVFILSTDYCQPCEELLNHKYIKKEIEKGNIIVLKDGKLKELIEEELPVTSYPYIAVYYKGIGFVDKDTAKKLELEWAKERHEKVSD